MPKQKLETVKWFLEVPDYSLLRFELLSPDNLTQCHLHLPLIKTAIMVYRVALKKVLVGEIPILSMGVYSFLESGCLELNGGSDENLEFLIGPERFQYPVRQRHSERSVEVVFFKDGMMLLPYSKGDRGGVLLDWGCYRK